MSYLDDRSKPSSRNVPGISLPIRGRLLNSSHDGLSPTEDTPHNRPTEFSGPATLAQGHDAVAPWDVLNNVEILTKHVTLHVFAYDVADKTK